MSGTTTVLLGQTDDGNLWRSLIADRLREEGFAVIISKGKEEIEERFQATDLLLLDARMGGNDHAWGIETVARLDAEGRLRRDVPVIFFSILPEGHRLFQPGFSSLREQHRPYAFLKKPFELDTLMDVIGDVLKKDAAGRAG